MSVKGTLAPGSRTFKYEQQKFGAGAVPHKVNLPTQLRESYLVPREDPISLVASQKMLYRIVVLALFATASAFNAPVSAVGASAIARAAVRAPAVVAMADEVEDKVKGIIAEQLGVELNTVLPGASFTEDLGADSLDAVELIMAIEEAFDIEIPDEEAETMTTPADCVKAIKGKL